MAKVYLDMYGVQGRVGNKTYYRSNGETFVREVVSPKNPKTDAQTTQRVLVKAVGKTYAEMKEICDHSFEGYGTGEAINPTSHNGNGATFTGLNVVAGHNLVVYRGGSVWFTITAREAGDDEPGGDDH